MAGKNLQASDFVHLHNHTQYSLLDGLTKIPEMIDAVRQMSMTSIAITDHGTMSGAIEFYKNALDQDVRPLIGIETYVATRSHKDKDPAKDKNQFHLILIAMNNTGYQNLMRLSTIANLEGFYYRPRIDHELLEKYNEGLIVLSGCIGGEVGDAFRQGQPEQAKEIARWYKEIFGDRYYLEVQDHGHPKHPTYWDEQANINSQILALGTELNIKCVVTSDAHYLRHQDQEAHEVLLCVQTGSFLTDTNRMSLKNLELHVTDPQEIIERWGKDNPELIRNTRAIAERCEVKIELGKILIPKFSVPKGQDERSFLHQLVYQGLAWRYGGKSHAASKKIDLKQAKALLPKHIVERAEYELRIINEMGFNGYFLIISDFVNWGKDNAIVFGPGRGSASGSIVSYGLRITELDPMKYDLLFERFLNPDRISMPDIDIDIQDSRRDEVIQYCVKKYGEERVANIVTFGRMAARNAVRDVSRVLQVPYAEADRMAKMIPPPVQGRHIPLAVSLKEDADLRLLYESSEEARRVFDLSIQLEGTIRSHGVHAAGVVIAPDEIVKFVPLEMAQKGVVATQYSMGPIEDVGLLKIDFLGLSNLTIIKNALRIVTKVYGKEVDLDNLPLDDEQTFSLFQRGDTTGVFQFESAGMKRYLKQLKPTEFDDLIAMNALYRPGPMQWIEDFISRKHGEKAIEFMHEAMEPALESTYGVMVYQEQVMQISKEMCGFTGGQADTLRKAIGKKNPAVLAKLKSDFIEGAIKTVKADRKLMEKFWKQMEAFAAYCFPKSHASCYAMIAYWTAFLKANYPTAFMAALMTSDFDNTDRLAIEIKECEHMGIEVLAPDINESFVEFGIVPNENKIRFGLAAIKNVGAGAVEEILRAREDGGAFTSLEDFFSRVNTKLANRKTIESLIKAGAFDSFADRSLVLNNLENFLGYASRLQKQHASGQVDLFGNLEVSSVDYMPKISLHQNGPQIPKREQLMWERELLGVYLSQHPLQEYQNYLSSRTTPLKSITSSSEGKRLTVGGIILTSREITTKNGQKMAFVQLADTDGEIELVLFPRVFEAVSDIWRTDKIIIASGKISSRGNGGAGGDLKLMVDEAKELALDSVLQKDGPSAKLTKTPPTPSQSTSIPSRIYIRLENSSDQQKLISLKAAIDRHQGDTEVVLVLGAADSKQIIRLPVRIHSSNESLQLLESVVGKTNVKVQ